MSLPTPQSDNFSFGALVHGAPIKPTRAQIKALQDECLKHAQVKMSPVHYFADGMYSRTLTIPKGTIVVGAIHRHEHMVALIQGEATVYTDEGMVRVKAPHVWVSKAGTKRALYTHKKCVFYTNHLNPSNETDIGKLEADILIPEDAPQAYLEN